MLYLKQHYPHDQNNDQIYLKKYYLVKVKLKLENTKSKLN